MKKIETDIEGVYIIEPDCFGDNRGWFMETYNEAKFKEMGIDNVFIQDNMSFSAQKGTLRGLHYQKAPFSQAKLVRCTRGSVIDVAVDIRKGSPTYGKWTSRLLSEENKRLFFIPRGMAHGFLTLTDNVEFQYKCDNFYHPEADGGISILDESLGIDWMIPTEHANLSDKDTKHPLLKEFDSPFTF